MKVSLDELRLLGRALESDAGRLEYETWTSIGGITSAPTRAFATAVTRGFTGRPDADQESANAIFDRNDDG